MISSSKVIRFPKAALSQVSRRHDTGGSDQTASIGVPTPELIASGSMAGPTLPVRSITKAKRAFRVLEMTDRTDGSKTIVVEFETTSGSGVVTVTADAFGRLELETVFPAAASGRSQTAGHKAARPLFLSYSSEALDEDEPPTAGKPLPV